MQEVLFQILILLLLLCANGLFAMAEIAIVSARKPRLRAMAERGNHAARTALELASSPNRFLATVQIGITLVGIVAGAFGGAMFSDRLAVLLADVPVIGRHSEEIAFGLVVLVITYLSLVLGELVPKRFGLGHPERVALWVARPMNTLSRLAGPAVAVLERSTEGLMRLLGIRPGEEATVNEDEVRGMMQEGLRAGSFNKIESQIVHRALDLDQLAIREIMTPRPKIIWLNQDEPHEQVWHKIVVGNHSYFPVYSGTRDHTVGVVSVKAIYANLAAGVPVRLKDLMTKPLIVPETQTVLQLVETFRQSGQHIALVADEFGSMVGLVTLNDVMEAIVGEFPEPGQRAKPSVVRRPDGTWLIDALIELAAVEQALPGFQADDSRGEYHTLAGYVVKQLGRVPHEGETFVAHGYIFEVLDMDQHRVDKVLVQRSGDAAAMKPL